MSPAHVHLLVNHVPVLGVALGLVVLAGATLRRHDVLMRSALALFVLSALAAIPTYVSGEPAEDAIEQAAGDVEAWVEPHEESAAVSLALVEMLGLLSVVGLWMARRTPTLPSSVTSVTLLIAAIALGSLAWTANLGGQIRHTEIRGEPSPAPAEGGGEREER
jgi:uncharacterized membrane protein